MMNQVCPGKKVMLRDGRVVTITQVKFPVGTSEYADLLRDRVMLTFDVDVFPENKLGTDYGWFRNDGCRIHPSRPSPHDVVGLVAGQLSD